MRRVQAFPVDLSFQQYQQWYVLGKGRLTPHGQLWICECQAGCFPKGQAEIQADALLEGRAQHCGCQYRARHGRKPSGRRYSDFTGQVFGSWLVLQRARSRPTGGSVWRCRCVCGTEREKLTSAVRDTQRLRCDRCRGAAQTLVHVGAIYNNRRVLMRVASPRKEVIVRCECLVCHRQATVSSHELMTKGYGCRCGSKTTDTWMMAFLRHQIAPPPRIREEVDA